MYIKIKHINRFLLFFACIFFAGFNYFNFVQADDAKVCDKTLDADCDGLTDAEERLYRTSSEKKDTDNDGYSDGIEVKSGYDPTKPAPGDKIEMLASKNSTPEDLSNQTIEPVITDNFAEEFQSFLAEKEDSSISTTDMNDFVSTKLTEKIGEPLTLDSLPEFDQSKLKILDQKYPLLSTEERLAQLRTDSSEYYTTLIYLTISNLPTTITTREDLNNFGQNFLKEFESFSSSTTKSTYFSDLGERLELLVEQTSEMQVPETILPMHIEMIRIAKGFLELKNLPDVANDPISKMALFAKIDTLTKLATDFIQQDVASHLKQMN